MATGDEKITENILVSPYGPDDIIRKPFDKVEFDNAMKKAIRYVNDLR